MEASGIPWSATREAPVVEAPGGRCRLEAPGGSWRRPCVSCFVSFCFSAAPLLLRPLIPKFACRGGPGPPGPPQDPPWKKPAPAPKPSTLGLQGTSTGPEENSSRYLASRGCYSTPGCGKAGERAPSMSRGISAAHHRRWAAYAMSLGFRV